MIKDGHEEIVKRFNMDISDIVGDNRNFTRGFWEKYLELTGIFFFGSVRNIEPTTTEKHLTRKIFPTKRTMKTKESLTSRINLRIKSLNQKRFFEYHPPQVFDSHPHSKSKIYILDEIKKMFGYLQQPCCAVFSNLLVMGGDATI